MALTTRCPNSTSRCKLRLKRKHTHPIGRKCSHSSIIYRVCKTCIFSSSNNNSTNPSDSLSSRTSLRTILTSNQWRSWMKRHSSWDWMRTEVQIKVRLSRTHIAIHTWSEVHIRGNHQFRHKSRVKGCSSQKIMGSNMVSHRTFLSQIDKATKIQETQLLSKQRQTLSSCTTHSSRTTMEWLILCVSHCKLRFCLSTTWWTRRQWQATMLARPYHQWAVEILEMAGPMLWIQLNILTLQSNGQTSDRIHTSQTRATIHISKLRQMTKWEWTRPRILEGQQMAKA